MNTTVGLLRVLAPDIFAFVLVTIVLIIAVCALRRVLSATWAAEGVPHADVVKTNRSLTRGVRWVWYVMAFGFVWHAFTVTWSLRIPRSDVDATGVYQQMDGLTQEKTR